MLISFRVSISSWFFFSSLRPGGMIVHTTPHPTLNQGGCIPHPPALYAADSFANTHKDMKGESPSYRLLDHTTITIVPEASYTQIPFQFDDLISSCSLADPGVGGGGGEMEHVPDLFFMHLTLVVTPPPPPFFFFACQHRGWSCRPKNLELRTQTCVECV